MDDPSEEDRNHYLEDVRAAFGTLVRATNEGRGRERGERLRIGMLPFTASELFVPALPRLAETLPGVTFAVETRVHLDDLHSDEDEARLDAVIRYGEGRLQGLAGVELTRMYMNDVTFCTGRTSGAAVLPRMLDEIARGRIDPLAVEPTIASWREAGEALLSDHPKIIVQR